MQAKDIAGIVPAIVTPFHDDESLNTEELRAHVRRVLDAGVHGVFAGGTNGEFYAMTAAERTQVLEVVVDEVAGRVPVYAGTGAATTAETVALSRAAEAAGADALSVITPWFAAASQSELVTHFTAAAASTSLPVVLYNIPARTGNALAPATVEKLSQVEGIAGVKDSSGSFDTILQYIERTDPERFAVLAGNDSLILWTLLAGGAGAITAVANVYPRTMVGIHTAWAAGDMAEARRLQDSIRPLRNTFRHGNPNTVVKTATAIARGPVGRCRAPFSQLPAEGLAELEQVLAADAAAGMA